jgi:hypothetical protein
MQIPDYLNEALVRSIHDARIETVDAVMQVLAQHFSERDFVGELETVLQVYKTSLKADYRSADNNNGSSSGDGISRKSERKKRAQTAYTQFIGKKIIELKESMHGVSSKEIMKVAMTAWKNLSDDEKRSLKDEFIRTRSGMFSINDSSDTLPTSFES